MDQHLLDANLVPPVFNLKDNRQRARAALIVGSIFLVITVLSLVTTYMEYSLLQAYDKGEASTADLEANDSRVALLAYVNIAVLIAFIVVFILWFRRAYYNLISMGVETRFTEGWAAGAWFVPFINLGRPLVIMTELAENYSAKVSDQYSATGPLNQGFLWLWWLMYILGGILGNIASRIRIRSNTIESFMGSDTLSMISDGMHIVSLAVLMLIIKRISTWENSLNDPMAAQ